MDEIRELLNDTQLEDHFENEVEFHSHKTLTLPAIKFDNENDFYLTLSKRIYSMRCSIVHSNPDFDENKAIPFTPTEENLHELRKEIALVKEIAKTVLAGSAE